MADVAGPVPEAAGADDPPRVVRVVADGERVDPVVGGRGEDLADVFVEDFVGEERFQGADAGAPAGVFLEFDQGPDDIVAVDGLAVAAFGSAHPAAFVEADPRIAGPLSLFGPIFLRPQAWEVFFFVHRFQDVDLILSLVSSASHLMFLSINDKSVRMPFRDLGVPFF